MTERPRAVCRSRRLRERLLAARRAAALAGRRGSRSRCAEGGARSDLGFESEVQIAGAQLDFPDREIAEQCESWVPFEVAIAIGWG